MSTSGSHGAGAGTRGVGPMGERPASPPPPRAVPWWVLVAMVVALAGGVLIGARFADPIMGAVGSLTSRMPRDDSMAVGGGHDHSGAREPEASATAGGATQYYTCGMHPWVILPRPGDCPICHMKLTPLDPSKFTGEVAIDPIIAQNIGVRVEPVTTGPLVRSIRTVGTVEYDETRVRDLNTKTSGWIERLHVDYVGAAVDKGEPLFELYSPAVLQAQEEFLLASRSAGGGGGASPDLAAAAREKLALLDVTPEQIDEIARAGRSSRTVTVRSPHGGTVIAKHANEGMRIEPGMQVFRIADLSRVWVLVTMYESQLPFLSEGMPAVMTLPYIPGRTFEGRVAYIYPYVDVRSREVQVRLEFENAGGVLRPGMFATVELRGTASESAVLAPREAVISTGARHVSFVSLGAGRFEPREVRLGAETGDGRVAILEGLSPGEKVVTSGQFLLDSESRVREALAKMMRGEAAVPPAGPPTLRVPGAGEALVPYPLTTCIVTDLPLESMGGAIVRAYEDLEVKFCCDSCPPTFEADPAKYLAKLGDRGEKADHP